MAKATKKTGRRAPARGVAVKAKRTSARKAVSRSSSEKAGKAVKKVAAKKGATKRAATRSKAVKKATKKTASRKSVTKSTAAKKAVRRGTAVRKASGGRSATKRTMARKVATKRAPAKRKVAGKAAVRKVAVKKGRGGSKRSPMRVVARTTKPAAPGKRASRPVRKAPSPVPVSTEGWPQAINKELDVRVEDASEGEDPQRRSFRERMLADMAGANPDPNEAHRGQTARAGTTHDRPGSQIERKRHLYPNGNRPNSGSARSSGAKGRRRDNMSQGGE